VFVYNNAVNEAFNGSFRRECLSQHHFVSFADAQEILNCWKHEYNTDRPHSSLHDLAPAHFGARASFTSDRIEPLFQPA
jgi:putative transposase